MHEWIHNVSKKLKRSHQAVAQEYTSNTDCLRHLTCHTDHFYHRTCHTDLIIWHVTLTSSLDTSHWPHHLTRHTELIIWHVTLTGSLGTSHWLHHLTRHTDSIIWHVTLTMWITWHKSHWSRGSLDPSHMDHVDHLTQVTAQLRIFNTIFSSELVFVTLKYEHFTFLSTSQLTEWKLDQCTIWSHFFILCTEKLGGSRLTLGVHH